MGSVLERKKLNNVMKYAICFSKSTKIKPLNFTLRTDVSHNQANAQERDMSFTSYVMQSAVLVYLNI